MPANFISRLRWREAAGQDRKVGAARLLPGCAVPEGNAWKLLVWVVWTGAGVIARMRAVANWAIVKKEHSKSGTA